MEDGSITDRERQLLNMQVKTLELDPSRVKYLEKWHDGDKKNQVTQSPSSSSHISEPVAKAMAKKIIQDAEQHRRNRQEDE